MALFMPTNVTPSTLGALGNGTVDATADMPVSWQVDGQNAMTAFRIRILANTTASTLLYDSGKKSDGCPFYGRDAGGNVVFFSYTIAASALAASRRALHTLAGRRRSDRQIQRHGEVPVD